MKLTVNYMGNSKEEVHNPPRDVGADGSGDKEKQWMSKIVIVQQLEPKDWASPLSFGGNC